MKFYETHFDEYIKSGIHNPLYIKKTTILDQDINKLDNLIIYGAPGIGKYTQSLLIIKDYSPSQLKYEKKLVISYNKTLYYLKISDIHYEVDMSILGCNSKLLWYEIFNQIIDSISSKNEKSGIIMCKYFHEIHNELLEIFYSYMQTIYNSSINIKFILITQDLSFIPESILNSCRHLNLSRPSRSTYNKCFKIKLPTENDISLITNIKDIKNEKNEKNIYNSIVMKNGYDIIENHKIVCDMIIEKILNLDELKFLNLRDMLYDICIYDLNILNCVWYILKTLVINKKINNKKLNIILIQTFDFLKLYNNNYRPIYHLEMYILYIATVIHDL
jgi:hypothetical protein